MIKQYTPHIQAALSGTIASLALAPLNIWPLMLISAGGYWLAVRALESNRQSFIVGWWYGMGFWGSGVSWVYVSIHEFGYMPAPVAALITLVFVASLSILHGLQTIALVNITRSPTARAFACPPLWVLMEWFRSWAFSGFPWLYAGYAAETTSLAHIAPLSGVFGLSLILVSLGVSGAWMMVNGFKHRHVMVWCIILALLLTAGMGIKQITWTQELKTSVRFTLIQPNIDQHLKWDPDYREPTLETLRSASLAGIQHTDVLVWPEAALPSLLHQEQAFLEEIEQLLNPLQVTLITGALTESNEPGPLMYNSILATAAGSGLYHKQRLVPFGEYVPMENWIRGIAPFFDLPLSTLSAGPSNQSLLKDGQGNQYAPLICYEVVYPDLVARQSREANFLITLSNDAWFGHSWGPLQHMQMARLRAIETQKPLIRATNTGLTAIVSAKGEMIEQAPRFVSTYLRGEIKPRTGTTPYARTGSWPVLLFCAFWLFGAAYGDRKK